MLCDGCHIFKTGELWVIILGAFFSGMWFMVLGLMAASILYDEPKEINIAEERLRIKKQNDYKNN